MSILITWASYYLNWSFGIRLLQFVYVIKSIENDKTFTNFTIQHLQTNVAIWLVDLKNIIRIIVDPLICKDCIVKFIKYVSSS